MDALALNKKLELIQWLSSIEDQDLIDKLTIFKQEETKHWWDLASVEEKQSIQQGIEDAEEGNLTPHSQTRTLYEKILSRQASGGQ